MYISSQKESVNFSLILFEIPYRMQYVPKNFIRSIHYYFGKFRNFLPKSFPEKAHHRCTKNEVFH